MINSLLLSISFPLQLGQTSLHLAARKGSVELASLLIEYGADPNNRDPSGYTPLHDAAELGKVDVSILTSLRPTAQQQ